MGVCDANYTFTAVDIGAYGSQSDGGVLWTSEFGRKLFTNELSLPKSKPLRNSLLDFPYYFVGDATFPLKKLLDAEKYNFNKRLSRVIENTFGILVARWRILQNALSMNVESAEKVVKATVVLHNFVKMHDGSYCPADFTDKYQNDVVIEGLWRKEIRPLKSCQRLSSNNASKTAFQIRDRLKHYLFVNKIY